MSYLAEVWSQRDHLLQGVAVLLGGAALVLVGTLVGLNLEKAWQIAAGVVAVGGVVAMFLGFFLYLLPPFLPAR
ncbi:MAG TPA: hypothetical protein VHH36_06915 [Candidatus Thermoplasmatota archaeon]|nr:hypothetical protein [Candidatus Thermoplasmatota archaeon]